MVFKCKMCDASLNIQEGDKITTCEYCGTTQTVPQINSERVANLYNRADHYRKNNEFDKALALYEEILNECPTDAEAYWSIILCQYGIEYVEEDGKRIPTINRTQVTSIFDDQNYKAALKYAEAEQSAVYQAEANAINEIQKEILAISNTEEPFDIFICYKETDERGRRTMDSVLATDIYDKLTDAGYKVFFARVTLDDKFGVAYEPYIFAALQSSKIMIAIGTKPEYFNAVWVRNEWSRYLGMIKKGAKKTLIPAYKDMDPYAMPEEFAHLQAINMGELGYQQDLVRGIRKIYNEISTEEERMLGSGDLMSRMYASMEARDWAAVEECATRIIKIKPQCAEARICRKLAVMGIFESKDMEIWGLPVPEDNLLEKIQSGDTFYIELLNTRLNNTLPENIEIDYNETIELFNRAQTKEDIYKCEETLKKLRGYKDAPKYYRQISDRITQIENRMRREKYNEHYKLAESDEPADLKRAIKYFESVPGYLDADRKKGVCRARLQEIERRIEKDKVLENKKTRKQVILISLGIVIYIVIQVLFIMAMEGII